MATTMIQHRVLALCLLLASLPIADAHAQHKQFKDWRAACDNLRTCHAYGFGAGAWTGAYLHLERGGAAGTLPRVTVVVEAAPGVQVTLAYNDKSTAGLPAEAATPAQGDDVVRIKITEPTAVAAMVARLHTAATLTATRIDPPGYQSDEETSDISLAGAGAALLWIDAQQKRLGTVTALIRRGDKPASSVPPPPPAPVVRAAKANPAPLPKVVPPGIIAQGKTLCGEDEGEGEFSEAARLSGTLVLYAFYCRESSGAYNHHYAFLVAPEGHPTAVQVPDFSVKIGALVNERPGILTNPSFDAKTMTMLTFGKGRGIGDCGDISAWVWDGTAFRLTRYDLMPDCKGIPADDWPTVYRTTVR